MVFKCLSLFFLKPRQQYFRLGRIYLFPSVRKVKVWKSSVYHYCCMVRLLNCSWIWKGYTALPHLILKCHNVPNQSHKSLLFTLRHGVVVLPWDSWSVFGVNTDHWHFWCVTHSYHGDPDSCHGAGFLRFTNTELGFRKTDDGFYGAHKGRAI